MSSSTTSHKGSPTPHKDSATPHKWAEVIKAWADGKTIQYRFDSGGDWNTYMSRNLPKFDAVGFEWRIKPERWYRVALMCNSSGEWIYATTRECHEIDAEGHGDFVRWLTERIYY